MICLTLESQATIRGWAREKIAVAVQRGVNDDGDQGTDVICTQHRLRQLVAIRTRRFEGHIIGPRSIHRFVAGPSAASKLRIQLSGI